MFSIRRKPKQSEDSQRPVVRASPSLPELSQAAQPLAWPENLVDIQEVRQHSSPHAAKSALAVDQQPIPFHKPFRTSPSNGANGIGTPSALDARRPRGSSARRGSQRKAKVPPTFNLMVVGGQGTGKTSLLRLLLETAELSPTATIDQRTAMSKFLRGEPKRTQAIQTACVEICESKLDRVLFSVIDTPGLDFRETRELKLERQVSSIMKYVDSLYADTMGEESKVVRQSKGDQHIHLCIYMVDPSAVMSASSRRAQSSLPIKTRSETTLKYSSLDTGSDDLASEDEDPVADRLTMSPTEIRVIRRLSARVNVLPVIARADSLTDESLAAVKKAISRDLRDAGLDYNVFGPAPSHEPIAEEPESPRIPATPKRAGISFANGNGHGNGHGDALAVARTASDSTTGTGTEDEDADERPSRPVIKLRRPRHAAAGSLRRSRSRPRLQEDAEDDELDAESVASVRFSASIVAKADLGALLPFALVAPERAHRRRRSFSAGERPVSVAGTDAGTVDGHALALAQALGTPTVEVSEDGHGPGLAANDTPLSPVSTRSYSTHTRSRPSSYLQRPPEDLRGTFVRKFRWGTIDVLDPSHCDFAAMRTAVLSSHMKALKTRTREVLYEKYRTEKLLARRVTRTISEDETKRLLEDLGL